MNDRWQRTAIAQSALSVVMPVRATTDALAGVVKDWHEHLERRGKPFEILLIEENGDKSATVLRNLSTNHPKARILRQDSPRGLGAALRSGIAAARYPLVLTVSSDGEFAPASLDLLLAEIDQADVVMAVRQSPPRSAVTRALAACRRVALRVLIGVVVEPRPAWHGWGEWRRRWLARMLFGLSVTDPESSLRLYRRSIFERIPIQSNGLFAQYEILAKANFLGCLFAEKLVANQVMTKESLEVGAFKAEARRVFRQPDFGPAIV